MWTFTDLIKNFFTHKDFLPDAKNIPGTMFTPLHFIFSAIVFCVVIFSAFYVSRKSEKVIKRIFTVIWIFWVIAEFSKIIWESTSGREVRVEWTGVMPLYPCSVFLYAMPLVIWGKGILRSAGCGYVCTLGLIGASVNFVYPATILGNYSCISMSGFHTFFFHGTMLFTFIVLLKSGMHSYKGIKHFYELLIPAIPLVFVSVIANIVNFIILDSDYMFFRLRSFIFAPIGAALPLPICVMLVYVAYLLLHAVFYIPSYISNKVTKKKTA